MRNTSSFFLAMKVAFTTVATIGVHISLVLAQTAKPTPPPPGPETGWHKFTAKVAGAPPAPSQGALGVNRRVIISGYGAVYGTFGEPDFWINPENPNNKPTYYLGAKLPGGSLNIDAGVQWEPKPSNIDENTILPPGWSVFMNVARFVGGDTPGTWQYTGNPGSWDNSALPWRADKGSLGPVKIDLHFHPDGKVVLRVKDKLVGPVQIDFPSGTLNTAVNLDIRRVVGLTQSGGELVGQGNPNATFLNYDGSWIHDLKFSDGHVAKIWRNSNGNLVTNPYVFWPSEGQAGLNTLLPPTRNEGETELGKKAPWIIDFSPRDPTKPYSTGKREDDEPGNFVPGYPAETTHIELWRKPSEVDGEETQKARSGPTQ